MIILVKTVETIVKQYELEVPDGTTTKNAYSRVEETEENRGGWIECDGTSMEGITEITTFDGKVLWTLPQ
jgi:hypothetical protein